MKTYSLIIAFGMLALMAACCCCELPDFTPPDWPDLPITIEIEPTFEPSPPLTEAPTPEVNQEPLPPEAFETETLLKETVIPVRDLHELAIRLQGLSPDIDNTINPAGSPNFDVGERRLFHVSNVDTDEQFDIYAILEYNTEHVYMWVDVGVRFVREALIAAADLFEEHTYPTNRAFFSSEWSPGVDNDPHLSILHAGGLGFSVAGYYSSADEFVSAVREDSNEMEMFYINIDNVTLNSDFYNGVLAHEFQHMIHWYNDRNEDTWLNEGFSELAAYINGFDPGGADYSFAGTPDTQLNSWPDGGPGSASANYGAGYLFTAYFLDRFGPAATQSLVAHEENTFASVDAVLQDLGTGMTHVDLFGDWIMANQLDDPSIDDHQYGYQELDPPNFDIEQSFDASDLPKSVDSTVHQYGTDYIELESNRPLLFSFTGSTQVGLMDTQPHSGKYLWWSNRGDDSDMSMTRSFDLSDVDSATLQFWCWYDIEIDWDYAYVQISTDHGETWEILNTPSGTPTNPNGNSFGWGYTGSSGSSNQPAWIQEEIDLSNYAGQEILIRFEYITDDAVNRPGFALDDIAIPEIGYFSDFEEDEGGWVPAGFIRHANILPQRWLIQLALIGSGTEIHRLELDQDQTGQWEIPLGSDADRAIITISALAPVTTELAPYHYEITPQ